MKLLINYKILIFLTAFSFHFIYSQLLTADPFNLFIYEKKSLLNGNSYNLETSLRPYFDVPHNRLSVIMRSEIFYNSGSPNLENMGNRYIGKGAGVFTGINFSYLGKYFTICVEPFYFYDQNKEINTLHREGIFANLNDVRFSNKKPFVKYGFREINLYFNHKEFGLGFSNANMWWGPGLHSSLTMTNNTSGFPYLMIGTLREKRYANMGFNIRYIYSELDKTRNNPYYTAIAVKIKFYNEPIFTLGFNQSILSLKTWKGINISKFDAATILFNSSKFSESSYQILVAYCEMYFPNSGLKVFFELGTTDKWVNLTDFINYPDHGIGSIFGFRHYGPFNNKNLIMGFEYARLVQSSYWDKRITPNWYGNPIFNYSSYEGRRWAAHSGSDSDDLYIYFGYLNDRFSFIPSLNYERHGVLYSRPPEVKMEIRLDLRYKLDEYSFNIVFEREWLEHAGFVMNDWRMGNVIWFGIERDLTNLFSNRFGLDNQISY